MDEQLKALYEFSRLFMRDTPEDETKFKEFLEQNAMNFKNEIQSIEPELMSTYESVMNPKKKSTSSTSPSQDGVSTAKSVQANKVTTKPKVGESYIDPYDNPAFRKLKGLLPKESSLTYLEETPKPITKKKATPGAPVTLQERSKQLTEKNKNIDWVERAINPSKYKDIAIKNEDGTLSTHKLEWGEVDDGYAIYPTIIMKDGKLTEVSSEEAFEHAKSTKSLIKVKDKNLAKYYSENGLIDHTLSPQEQFYKENFPEGIVPKEEPKQTFDLSLVQKVVEAKQKEKTTEGRLEATKKAINEVKPGSSNNPMPNNINEAMGKIAGYTFVNLYKDLPEEEKPEYVKNLEKERENALKAGPRVTQQVPQGDGLPVKKFDQYQRWKESDEAATKPRELVAANNPEYIVYDIFGDVKDPLKYWNLINLQGEYDKDVVFGLVSKYVQLNYSGKETIDEVEDREDLYERLGLKELIELQSKVMTHPGSIKQRMKDNPMEYQRLMALPYIVDQRLADLQMSIMEAEGRAESGKLMMANADIISKNNEALEVESEQINQMTKKIEARYMSDPQVKQLDDLMKRLETTGDSQIVPVIEELVESINAKRSNDPDVLYLKKRIDRFNELKDITDELRDETQNIVNESKYDVEQFSKLVDKSIIADKEIKKTKYYEWQVELQKEREDMSWGESIAAGGVNSLVKAGWRIVEFIPAIAASVLNAANYRADEYTTADRFLDWANAQKQGIELTTKEREDFISNGEVNLPQLAATIVEQIPIMMYFVALGKYGGLSKASATGMPLAQGQNIMNTIRNTIATRGTNTIAATYVITYSEKYQEALKKGYSGAAVFAYANEMSFVEGLSELVFDEYGALSGASDINLDHYLMQVIGKKGAQKAAKKTLAKGLIGEPIEEILAGLNESIVTGDHKSWSEWAEIATSSMILSGGISIPGALKQNQQVRQFALYKAAQNPAVAKEYFATQLSPKELDTIMQEVNSYSAVLGQMPEGISEVKKAHIAALQVENNEERNRIIVAQNKLAEAQTAGDLDAARTHQQNLNIYQNALKKRNAAIEVIYQETQYDQKVNEEMRKVAEQAKKETPTEVEMIEAIAERFAKPQVVKAEITKGIKKRYKNLNKEQREAIAPLIDEQAELAVKYNQLLKEINVELASGKEVDQSKVKLQSVIASQIREVEQKIVNIANNEKPTLNINQKQKGVQDDTTIENVDPGQSPGTQGEASQGDTQGKPGVPQTAQNEVITEQAGVSKEAPVVAEAKAPAEAPVESGQAPKEAAKTEVTSTGKPKTLINKIKNYATEVISNRKEVRRLSQEAEQGRKRGGIRNVEASILLITGKEGNVPIKGREAQQQAIEEYAKSEGIWFENIPDSPEIGLSSEGLGVYVDSGVENMVYIPEDNPNIVRKAMRTTDPFNKNNENEVLYHLDTRISEHNAGIGSSVPYTVVGFGKLANGDFVVITEQPRVKAARLATRAEIASEMEKMGYEADGKDAFSNENHYIADVNPKNVLVDEAGNLHFIDTLYDVYEVNESDGFQIDSKTTTPTEKVEVSSEVQQSRTIVEKRAEHLYTSKRNLKKSHKNALKSPAYAEEYNKYQESIDELEQIEKDLPDELKSDYASMRERFEDLRKKKADEQIQKALQGIADKLGDQFGNRKYIVEEEFPSYSEMIMELASGLSTKFQIYGEALWEKVQAHIQKLMPKTGKGAFTKTQLDQLKQDVLDMFPDKDRVQSLIDERAQQISQSNKAKTKTSTMAKRVKKQAEDNPAFQKAYEKLKGVFEAGYNPNSMEVSQQEAETFVNEVMQEEAGEQMLLRSLETGQLRGVNASYTMYAVYKYYSDQLSNEELTEQERDDIRDKMVQASAIFMKEQILSGQTVKAYHALSRLINPEDAKAIAEKMARRAIMKEMMDQLFHEKGMSAADVGKLHKALKEFMSNKSKKKIIEDIESLVNMTPDDVGLLKEEMEIKDIIALLRGKSKEDVQKVLKSINDIFSVEKSDNKRAGNLLDQIMKTLSMDDLSELSEKIKGMMGKDGNIPTDTQDLLNALAQRSDLTAEEITSLLELLEAKFPHMGLKHQTAKLAEALKLADQYTKGQEKTEDKLLAGKVRNMFRGMNDQERVDAIKALLSYMEDQNMDISQIRGKKPAQKKYQGQGTWPKRKKVERGTVEGADQLLERMQKMTPSQRRKLIQKYIQVMGERDIITDERFNDIMAEVMGLRIYGEQEQQALTKMLDTQKAYNEATDEYVKLADEYIKQLGNKGSNVSQLNDKMLTAERLMYKTRRASLRSELEMSMVLSGKKTWGSVGVFLVQGNLLIWLKSHLRNFYANIYRMVYSTPARIQATMIDMMLSGIGHVTKIDQLSDNSRFNRWAKITFNKRRTANAFVGLQYFTPNFIREFGRTSMDLVSKYGISPTELSKRDAKKVMNIVRSLDKVYNQPLKRMKGLLQGNPHESPYTEKTTLKDVVMATFGLPAEVNFRFLGIGDKPFRTGYESAHMAELAWLIGFEGKEIEVTVKSKGENITFMERAIQDSKTPGALKDKYQKRIDEIVESVKQIWDMDENAVEAMKSDGVGKWIRKMAEDYGAWSTYQMTNPLNPKLTNNKWKERDASIKSGLMKMAEMMYGRIAHTKTRIASENIMKMAINAVIPYETTLLNIIIETAKYTSPNSMILKGLYHIANGERRKAVDSFGIASVGYAFRSVSFMLTGLGLIKPPLDDDDKKENQFARSDTEQCPGSINIDGIIRHFLKGGSPIYQKGDRTWMLQFMGTPGLVMLANSYYHKKRDGITNLFNMPDTLYDGSESPDGTYIKAMAKVVMGTSFLQNANVVLNTLMGESSEYEDKKVLTQMVTTGMVAPFIPSTLRTYLMSKNHEYQKVISDDNMFKHLRKTIEYNLGREVDAETRINAWGERMPYTPNDVSKARYWFFSSAQPRQHPGQQPMPKFIQGQGDPRVMLSYLYADFASYYFDKSNAKINPADMLPPIILNKIPVGDHVDKVKENEEGFEPPEELVSAKFFKLPPKIMDEVRVEIGQLRFQKMNNVLYWWQQDIDNTPDLPYNENREYWDAELIKMLKTAYTEGRDEGLSYVFQKYMDEIIDLARDENKKMNDDLTRMRSNQSEYSKRKVEWLNIIRKEASSGIDESMEEPEDF